VGNPKGKVYRKTPHTAEALQNKIRNVSASIMADISQHVSWGFLQRCKACLRATNNQFEYLLYYHSYFTFQFLVLIEQMVSSHRIWADISVVILNTNLELID
jgi:hypothetical protein